MKLLTAAMIGMLSLMLLLSCSIISQTPSSDGSSDTVLKARPLEASRAPEAKISTLPREVSNGTSWTLDASDSNDDGFISNFTWEITTPMSTEYYYSVGQSYRFQTLGLYLITLTVTDNNGTSDQAFTAVYAILDSDSDGLPDWWEMWFFLSLEEAAAGDYDGDGWTNLQEYANGIDPTEEDARPGLVHELMNNWMYIVAIAVVLVVVFIALQPTLRRRRKQEDKRKIDAAIEIERLLQEK